MERPAAVAGHRPTPRTPAGTTHDLPLIAIIVAVELALLAAGFAIGRPFAASLLAAAVAYFFIAFRFPDLAWALVWVAVPLSMERTLPGGVALSVPTEPMIAIALAAWGLRMVATGGVRLPSSPLHVPLLVLAGVALLSTVLGLRPLDGAKAWFVSAVYVTFGYVYFFVTPCDRMRRERWIRLVVLLGAACGLYGAARVVSSGIGLEHAYGIARPFFANHGSYGALLGMILPLAFLLAAERRGRERLLFGSAALLIFLGVMLSFSRATWLSLVVILPLTSWIWLTESRSLRPAVLLAGLAVAVTAFVVIAGVSTKITRHAETVVQSENASNLERVNRWMAAIEMTRARPWLGVGHGGYADAYRTYRRKIVITERAFEHMDAHSEVLRLVSEDGFIGLGAAVWFLGTAGWVGFRVVRSGADRETRLLALALLAGLGAYCIHGTIDSYLGLDKITVPFWTGLGALGALSARFAPSRERTRRRVQTGPPSPLEAGAG